MQHFYFIKKETKAQIQQRIFWGSRWDSNATSSDGKNLIFAYESMKSFNGLFSVYTPLSSEQMRTEITETSRKLPSAGKRRNLRQNKHVQKQEAYKLMWDGEKSEEHQSYTYKKIFTKTNSTSKTILLETTEELRWQDHQLTQNLRKCLQGEMNYELLLTWDRWCYWALKSSAEIVSELVKDTEHVQNPPGGKWFLKGNLYPLVVSSS